MSILESPFSLSRLINKLLADKLGDTAHFDKLIRTPYADSNSANVSYFSISWRISRLTLTAFFILSLKDNPPIFASSPRLSFFYLVYFVLGQNYNFFSSLYLEIEIDDNGRSSF